jgi:hypothetical protein
MNNPIIMPNGVAPASASFPSVAPSQHQLSGSGSTRGGAPLPPPCAAFVPGLARSDLHGVVNNPPLSSSLSSWSSNGGGNTPSHRRRLPLPAPLLPPMPQWQRRG